jgi:hypothetical protein
MIRLELQPEVEAQLATEAQARGVALDRYVAELVGGRLPGLPKTHSVAEAIQRILELREDSDLRGLNPKDLINEGRRLWWRSPVQ